MSNCPKCGGAMERQEIGGQTFLQCLREGVCQGRILLRNGEAPMGKEWTPERRAKFQATVEARRMAQGKSGRGGQFQCHSGKAA